MARAADTRWRPSAHDPRRAARSIAALLLVLVFISLMIAAAAPAGAGAGAPSGKRLWARTVISDPGETFRVAAVAVDRQGCAYLCGSAGLINVVPASSASAIVVVKYDPDGGVVWRCGYEPPQGGRAWATAAAIDPFGALVVVGRPRAPSPGWTWWW
jgi:hypothetical protein